MSTAISSKTKNAKKRKMFAEVITQLRVDSGRDLIETYVIYSSQLLFTHASNRSRRNSLVAATKMLLMCEASLNNIRFNYNFFKATT